MGWWAAWNAAAGESLQALSVQQAQVLVVEALGNFYRDLKMSLRTRDVALSRVYMPQSGHEQVTSCQSRTLGRVQLSLCSFKDKRCFGRCNFYSKS